MFLSVWTKRDSLVAVLVVYLDRKLSKDEVAAGEWLNRFLSQALLNIRQRNRKVHALAEAARHEILLHTQASCFHDPETESGAGGTPSKLDTPEAGSRKAISIERHWEAGTGSDFARLWRSGDGGQLLVLADLTANDSERQAALIYLDTWFSLLSKTGLDARAMLKRLNSDMVRRRAECYASIVVVRRSVKKGLVEVAGCGDISLVVFNHETMTARALSFGPAAGIGEEGEIEGRDYVVKDGDIFCLASDGIAAARKKNGSLFGEDALGDFIRKNYWLSPQDLSRKLVSTVLEKADRAVNSDDMTVAILKIQGSTP